MKVLFITYCMDAAFGSSQIGVHKRGLRIGLELAGRGHEVACFCTGRHTFTDALTAAAEARIRFVDWHFAPPTPGDDRNRTVFLRHLAELRPDVVVIGEAPMAGTLLETTLCAVELGIPTVLLDNAYHPDFVEHFCRRFGAMFDGIVLSAPSGFHGHTGYGYLEQVPPYIDPSVAGARRFLQERFGTDGPGLGADPLLVVLAYDRNVERLGVALTERLDGVAFDVLFLSPDPQTTRRSIPDLPHARLRGAGVTRAGCVPPPEDPVLFGLLQMARCAVTKAGFMQITESLALDTPVVGFCYPGDEWVASLPRRARALTHATTNAQADAATLTATRSFLTSSAGAARAVHNGDLGAAARTADYLEALPRHPRPDTTADAALNGFRPRRVARALRTLYPRGVLDVGSVRCSYLRSFPDHEVHSVVCHYTADGVPRFMRLWGRLFPTREALRHETQRATQDPQRGVLLSTATGRMLIERDLGTDVLPGIRELAAQSSSEGI